MSATVSLLSLSPQSRTRSTRSKTPTTPSGSYRLAWGLIAFVLAVLDLILLGTLVFGLYWTGHGTLSPSGGVYFYRPILITGVPGFQQNDPRWKDDAIGATHDSLGAEGCAVTSAAMVLNFYGVATDPQKLNQYLSRQPGGYTPEGWIYWEKAADLSEGRLEKAYEDAPSYALLDANLWQGNPVIVRLSLPNGHTHFVVIVGKEGWDYLIQDPALASAGVYPLKRRAQRVTGLRFYRQLSSPAAALQTVATALPNSNTYPPPATSLR